VWGRPRLNVTFCIWVSFFLSNTTIYRTVFDTRFVLLENSVFLGPDLCLLPPLYFLTICHHWLSNNWIWKSNRLVPWRRLVPISAKIRLFLLWGLLTYGAEPFLRICQLCSYSRTSQHFMEPEGLLTCSQESSTGSYPEPDRSSPYQCILSLLRPILILSTHLRLGLPNGLFLSDFPHKYSIWILGLNITFNYFLF
jgi:hypothetical protein